MTHEVPIPDPEQALRERTNRNFGHRIVGVLLQDSAIRDRFEGGITFKNKDNPDKSVRVSSPPSSVTRQKLHELLPELGGTTLEFYDWSSNPEATSVTTPYGLMEGAFFYVGADNEIYSFSNYYIFNLDGAGHKYEMVLHYFPYTGNEPRRRLSFSPKESDSRMVPLSPNDYEKVGSLLTQVENGEFERIA